MAKQNEPSPVNEPQKAKSDAAHRLPDGRRHIPGLKAGEELSVGMIVSVGGQTAVLKRRRNAGGFWAETLDGRQIKVKGCHSVASAFRGRR